HRDSPPDTGCDRRSPRGGSPAGHETEYGAVPHEKARHLQGRLPHLTFSRDPQATAGCRTTAGCGRCDTLVSEYPASRDLTTWHGCCIVVSAISMGDQHEEQ